QAPFQFVCDVRGGFFSREPQSQNGFVQSSLNGLPHIVPLVCNNNMLNRTLIIGLVVSLLASAATAATPNWAEILGPAQGKVPAPLPDVIWRTDLQKALLESQQTNRPLFVTLRCLPCKQCSAFDKDVMDGGPLLSPLLSQFITVRLTNA